ncbi:MAG: hypothetical protein PF505_09220 [Vallitaleaceae bacterium]|nr:hypothetical protein [Vallitaleaceae bacterium]
MKTSKLYILFTLILMIVILAGCNGATEDNNTNTDSPAKPTEDISTDAPLIELTLDELASYTGKNGNLPYIAVNGIIYDVTDVPQWASGDHNGYEAGKDLTDFFPHEASRLDRAVKVGILVVASLDTPSTTDNQTESNGISESSTLDIEGDDPASTSTEVSNTPDSDTPINEDNSDTSNNDTPDTTSNENTSTETTPIEETPTEAEPEPVEPVVEPTIEPVPTEPTVLTFTTQSLAQYNGKNGQPAYIAYMGDIYDVSQLSEWRNGNHHGIEAGYDVTSDLQYAPHGAEELNGVPIIGILVP